MFKNRQDLENLLSIAVLLLLRQLIICGCELPLPVKNELRRYSQSAVGKAFTLLVQVALPMSPTLVLNCC